jgi:predicted XRE-type DNA-binding protein
MKAAKSNKKITIKVKIKIKKQIKQRQTIATPIPVLQPRNSILAESLTSLSIIALLIPPQHPTSQA